MAINLFRKKNYVSLSMPKPEQTAPPEQQAPSVPDGLWVKCASCQKTLHVRECGEHKVCPACGTGFRLTAWERVAITADCGSFRELDAGLNSKNPMNYPGYEAKVAAVQKSTGLMDAVVSGRCTVGGNETLLLAMDSGFIMASMGSVVGEKICRAFEYAARERLPVVIFTASGGARMQEGIISLMQMAKTSAAVKRHSSAGLLYVSVLCDPTTGGVTASFAMLGDIILAEPKALVGFAGRRVIEQTIKQKLPDGFQRAEFAEQHGFVDMIVPRDEMRGRLADILSLHAEGDGRNV